MKTRLQLLAGGVIAIAFAVWAGLVLVRRWHELPVLELSVAPIVLVVLLAWAVVALNSMIVEFSATRMGEGLGLAGSQRLGFLVSFLNYFLPLRAGLAVRVAYYMRLAGHDPLQFTAVMVTASLIVQVVSVVALAFVLVHVREARWPLGLLVAVTFGALLLTIWLSRGRPVQSTTRLGAALSRVQEGAHVLVARGGHPMMVIALLSAMALILTAARYMAGIGLLQGSLTPGVAVAMAAAAGLSSLVAMTFGGLGVREAAMVVIGQLCDIPAEVCLMLALVDRVLVSAALVVTGVPAMIFKKKY